MREPSIVEERGDKVVEPEIEQNSGNEDNLKENYITNRGMVPYVIGKFFGM